MGKTGLAMIAALALAGCGKAPSDETKPATPATAPADVASAEAAPAAFAICSACHSLRPGVNGIGPSLAGVVGQKAGHLGEAYRYTDAMKGSGLTWDPATLDRFLTRPQAAVPGTKMTFSGLADPAARKAVIDYLAAAK